MGIEKGSTSHFNPNTIVEPLNAQAKEQVPQTFLKISEMK